MLDAKIKKELNVERKEMRRLHSRIDYLEHKREKHFQDLDDAMIEPF